MSFASMRNSGCLNSHACSYDQSLGPRVSFRGQRTLGPCPGLPSSGRLTLWKSYLFSWRTKLAKLLCLKCFGSTRVENFSPYSGNRLDTGPRKRTATFGKANSPIHAISRVQPRGSVCSRGKAHTSRTTKESPSRVHLTMSSSSGSSSMLFTTVSATISEVARWAVGSSAPIELANLQRDMSVAVPFR